MRRQRHKVRPARVKYADGFKRWLDSFSGAYERRPWAPFDYDDLTPEERSMCREVTFYKPVKPIVIPAGSLTVGATIHVEGAFIATHIRAANENAALLMTPPEMLSKDERAQRAMLYDRMREDNAREEEG